MELLHHLSGGPRVNLFMQSTVKPRRLPRQLSGAARQASLSIIISRSSLKLTSIESVMPSSHLILCHPPFLLPPIPPSITLEKGMAIYFSILAWRIPWTEEPSGLQSMGSGRDWGAGGEGDDRG